MACIWYRASGMPVDAMKSSLRELKRLKKMPQQMPEHAMLRYNATSHNDVSFVMVWGPTFKRSEDLSHDYHKIVLTLS